jgi:hypothetical protein
MRIAAVFCVTVLLLLPAAAATDPATDPLVEPPTPTSEAIASDVGVVDLFRDLGLFGTFAADCGRPAAPNNPHVSVTQESPDLVIETHFVGDQYAANHYSVRSARRLGSDRLEIKVVFVPGMQAEQLQTLEIVFGKGTRRTIFNRVDDGEIRVERGIAVANGSKTPLLKKCP